MTEIKKPLKKGFTIYTKSECSFCFKVHHLLQEHNFIFEEICCDEYLLDDEKKQYFLSFIKDQAQREYRTFPMVFYNGFFIGGFTDTDLLVNKTLLRFDDESF